MNINKVAMIVPVLQQFMQNKLINNFLQAYICIKSKGQHTIKNYRQFSTKQLNYQMSNPRINRYNSCHRILEESLNTPSMDFDRKSNNSFEDEVLSKIIFLQRNLSELKYKQMQRSYSMQSIISRKSIPSSRSIQKSQNCYSKSNQQFKQMSLKTIKPIQVTIIQDYYNQQVDRLKNLIDLVSTRGNNKCSMVSKFSNPSSILQSQSMCKLSVGKLTQINESHNQQTPDNNSVGEQQTPNDTMSNPQNDNPNKIRNSNHLFSTRYVAEPIQQKSNTIFMDKRCYNKQQNRQKLLYRKRQYTSPESKFKRKQIDYQIQRN